MQCEKCYVEHSGEYGTGRFCSSKCARSYSTKEKRLEINEKVASKLKNRPPSKGFIKGFDIRRKPFTKTEQLKGVEVRLDNLKKKYETSTWDELPLVEKRRRILSEQNEVCNRCGLKEWLGEILTLELHHIDGDDSNDKKENLCILCPNCHSLTPNYRNRKRMAQ